MRYHELLEIDANVSFEDDWQDIADNASDAIRNNAPTMKKVGNIDSLDLYINTHPTEITYMLMDQEAAAAYIMIESYRGLSEISNNKAFRVIGVRVMESYRGKNLGIKLYKWLMSHIARFLVADERQTKGGMNLWKQLVRDKQVFVYRSDGDFRRYPTPKLIKSVNGLNRVYDYDAYVLFATLDSSLEVHTDKRKELVRLINVTTSLTHTMPVKSIEKKVKALSDDEVEKYLAHYRKPADQDW